HLRGKTRVVDVQHQAVQRTRQVPEVGLPVDLETGDATFVRVVDVSVDHAHRIDVRDELAIRTAGANDAVFARHIARINRRPVRAFEVLERLALNGNRSNDVRQRL